MVKSEQEIGFVSDLNVKICNCKNIVKNNIINVCFSIGEDDMRLACQMGGLNLSKLAIWIVNFKLNVFKGVKKSGPIFLIPKKPEKLED